MECPFCAETIKDEAIVCRHCGRDLRVVRPMLLEIQELVAELDKLRRDLDRANARLEKIKSPFRYIGTLFIIYVLPPSILLVVAHVLVTIVLDVSPLYLRLLSVVIPLPFGFASYPIHKIGIRGATALGVATSALSITCMLTITGLHDEVPILPGPWIEWREVLEYSASISLAFVSGSILGVMIFQILPSTLAQGGKPNPAAFRIARMLGPHVGDEQLRRMARIIQDLIRTAVPLAGIAATAGGSIYAGLKSVFGW